MTRSIHLFNFIYIYIFVSSRVQHQYIVTYSTQKNRVVKRKNRTIMEMSRCLLVEKKVFVTSIRISQGETIILYIFKVSFNASFYDLICNVCSRVDYCLHAVPVQFFHVPAPFMGHYAEFLWFDMYIICFFKHYVVLLPFVLLRPVECMINADAFAWILSLLEQFSSSILEGIADYADLGLPLVSLSKGLELNTLRMMSQIIPHALRYPCQTFIAISGPSLALEMMHKLPTGYLQFGKFFHCRAWQL